jgi:hypothetical protein
LHLGSSNFDFRDPRQVEKLAAEFEATGKEHLAIVMHMQTRSPALERLMRQIGLKRFLLASDCTDGLNLRAYYANEKASLH